MDNTALAIVKSRLQEIVASIEVGSPTAPLFAAVYQEGDAIDETLIGQTNGEIAAAAGSALAAIVCGSERVEETTTKLTLIMPFSIEVAFGVPTNSSPTAHAAYILGELQATMLADANRILSSHSAPASAAIDVRYTGGGSELFPLDDENPCSRWGIIPEWEVTYRQRTTDPTVIT